MRMRRMRRRRRRTKRKKQKRREEEEKENEEEKQLFMQTTNPAEVGVLMLYQDLSMGGLQGRKGSAPCWWRRHRSKRLFHIEELGERKVGKEKTEVLRQSLVFTCTSLPHRIHLWKQRQYCAFKSYLEKYSCRSVNYNSKLNKCTYSSVAVAISASA